MPHQCVRCGKFYEDASKQIIEGCSCGSRFFFFMKKETIPAVQEVQSSLSDQDKKQIEKDALDLIGEEKPEKPVVLDLESVRILKPGKFELDIVDLFKGEPLVFKLADGKYVIDIASALKSADEEN